MGLLLGPIVTDLINVPLNWWYHTSELTADRVGFLSCRDISTIQQLFSRLGIDAPVNTIEQLRRPSDPYPYRPTKLAQLLQYMQV